MTGQPEVSRLLLICTALALLLAGCQLEREESKSTALATVGPNDSRAMYARGTLVPLRAEPAGLPSQVALQPPAYPAPMPPPQIVELARASAPADPSAQQKAEAIIAGLIAQEDISRASSASSTTVAGLAKLPLPHIPAVVREENDSPIVSVPDTASKIPAIPLAFEANRSISSELPVRQIDPIASSAPVTEGLVALPPIPAAPLPIVASASASNAAGSSSAVPSGPIVIGGQPLSFDALAKMVDANGGSADGVGCASCGDCGPGRPCAPGGLKCEPFPDRNAFERAMGIIYEIVTCPDPCYQPKWEPIADSAFFVDPARPVSNTRFSWDYFNHFAYPDRAEYFWAASPKGPSPTDSLKAVPYLNYHQLALTTEIATGSASVAISMPYRSWDAEPFAHSSAGFSDMTITAKTLLVDSELFLCAMQMRTGVPIGNAAKGLGDGHVSLEPGIIFGVRLTPDTFLQAEVQEWIPLGGDPNSQGAFLQWGLSVNQSLWQPVKDVKVVGTLELTGYSFQAGQFTDPVLGPQKLSGENNLALGNGYRFFFGKFDVGIAGNFGISGKYMAREQMEFDLRFRY